jgi:hypothetical protein
MEMYQTILPLGELFDWERSVPFTTEQCREALLAALPSVSLRDIWERWPSLFAGMGEQPWFLSEPFANHPTPPCSWLLLAVASFRKPVILLPATGRECEGKSSRRATAAFCIL